MSEEKFWYTTPRKLVALYNVHMELNSLTNNKAKESTTAYIDQVL